MEVAVKTPAVSKDSKTLGKSCVAVDDLVLKMETNTNDSSKLKKPTKSKVPISIKSKVNSWKGVLKSRGDRETATRSQPANSKTPDRYYGKDNKLSIELMKSKQNKTNPEKEKDEEEIVYPEKLDNKNVRADNCQRVHIDYIRPDFTGNTNNEITSSLASAKPIPDLATIFKRCSCLTDWLTNSMDDYLATTSLNPEVSFYICDKISKDVAEANEYADKPSTSFKGDEVVADESNVGDTTILENTNFAKDICSNPDEEAAFSLNSEALNTTDIESGYRSISPEVKTINFNVNTDNKDPFPNCGTKQNPNTAANGESEGSQTLDYFSGLTLLVEKPNKLENIDEKIEFAANQEVATGHSFAVDGVSKNYQFPSKDVNPGERTCRVPRSYVDCSSEVLQKTTNLESAVLVSSLHISNEAEVMDQLSHSNLIDTSQGDEKSFFDDEISECHCTSTCSLSHSGPNCGNSISDANLIDTWDYRFYDAPGTAGHDNNGNHSCVQESYGRRCCSIHNSTYTRLGLKYMPYYPTDRLRHKRNGRIYGCCSRNRQATLAVPFTDHIRRKLNNAIKKTLRRWMVFRKTRFKIGCRRFSDCPISLIQRTMLLQNVDAQTEMLYFKDTGTLAMKDQKSMAIVTSLRLNSWLASYNKSQTDSQIKKIHENMKNIQQEHIRRGASMFPMPNNNQLQFLKPCTTTQQMKPVDSSSPGYPLRLFLSSPGRELSSFISCGKQTDQIDQKEVSTIMDRLSKDIITETEELKSGDAAGCVGYRVHPLKTCCWTDKTVLDTGYCTVKSIIGSPSTQETGNLFTNYDSKTGLYKPFMPSDGSCCKNFQNIVPVNVATKPNFTASIKSFLKSMRKPCSPIRKETVDNSTNDCDIESYKNTQSTQIGYSEIYCNRSVGCTTNVSNVADVRSTAISTCKIICNQSIGCTTDAPDIDNVTVLTCGNADIGGILVNVLKQDNASQYSQPNLAELPKPEIKSTAVNTETQECQNVADVIILKAAKESSKYNHPIFSSTTNTLHTTSGFKVVDYSNTSRNADILPVLTRHLHMPTNAFIVKCFATKATSVSTFKKERSTSFENVLIIMDHEVDDCKSQAIYDSVFIKKAATQTDAEPQFNYDTSKSTTSRNFHTRTVSQMTSIKIDTKEIAAHVNPEMMPRDRFVNGKQAQTKNQAISNQIQVETTTRSVSNFDDEAHISGSSKRKSNICDTIFYHKVHAATSYNSIDKNHNNSVSANEFTKSDDRILQCSHCEDKYQDLINFLSLRCTRKSPPPTPQNEETCYFETSAPKIQEAVPKRTKNATTGPYLVAKVPKALSPIDISPSVSRRCAQVQYSRQNSRDIPDCVSAGMLTDMNMKNSFGTVTGSNCMTQSSFNKRKSNATVQCSACPMRKISSQRSTKIGKSQLMSVFTLCSSNKDVSTQYSKSCEKIFYEEPHHDDMPKTDVGKLSEKSSIMTLTDNKVKPTVLQAANGENYAFNYPPSIHEGLSEAQPRSPNKSLSSDTYSPRNRSSFRSASYNGNRESIFYPQWICPSNHDDADSSIIDADSSSLNAVKWLRKCGLPLGLPIDNEAYTEEQMKLLDHFRKAMPNSKSLDSPQSPNSPQLSINETKTFLQAPIEHSKHLSTTFTPKPALAPPIFNTDSMEVTPPSSQILRGSCKGKVIPEDQTSSESFLDYSPNEVSVAFGRAKKTDKKKKEDSRGFQLQEKAENKDNKDKTDSKEIQLQVKPDSCDAGTDCIPVCTAEVRDTKSVSAVTSRVILPPCSCRDRCPKHECLFVYDSPKCVIHYRSLTDVSLQFCPSNRNVELETSKEHAVDEYVGSNASMTSASYTCFPGMQRGGPPDLHAERLSAYPLEHLQFIHENTPREFIERQRGIDSDPSIEVLRKALELSPKMFKTLYETSKLLACAKCSDAAVSTDDRLTTSNISTQPYCPEQISAGILTSRFFINERAFNSQESVSFLTTTTPTTTTQLKTPPVKLQRRDTFTQPSCKLAKDGITQYSYSRYSTKALDVHSFRGVDRGCGSLKDCLDTNEDDMSGWCYKVLNRRIGCVKDCLRKQIARHVRDKVVCDMNLSVMDSAINARQTASRVSCMRGGPSCNISSVVSSLDICGDAKKDLSQVYYTLSAIEGRIRRFRSHLPD